MEIDDDTNNNASIPIPIPVTLIQQSLNAHPHVESAVQADHVTFQTTNHSSDADEMKIDNDLCTALHNIHISPVKSETEQFAEQLKITHTLFPLKESPSQESHLT